MPNRPAAQVTIYQDEAGLWRWHQRSSNGLITAESGQGYRKRASAIHAAEAALMPRRRTLRVLEIDGNVNDFGDMA